MWIQIFPGTFLGSYVSVFETTLRHIKGNHKIKGGRVGVDVHAETVHRLYTLITFWVFVHGCPVILMCILEQCPH